MNMRWDLTPLYESFESELFINEMKKLDSISKDIVKWAENNLDNYDDTKGKIEHYLKFGIESDYLIDKLYRFIHLTRAVNSIDEDARKYSDIIREKISFLTKPEVMFMKWMKKVDVEKEAEKSDLIKEHLFILNEIKEKAEYMLSEDEEILVSDMMRTGSSSWSMFHSTLVSDLTAEIDGKEIPISIVRSMSSDISQKKRKKGYDAEMKAYETIAMPSSYCINSIKGEVISLSKKRGYKSPLQMTLKDSRMSEETLNTMLKAIKGRLPIFRKYFIKKAKMLGHKNGLPFYELDAPMGKSNRKFTYEEAREFIVTNFRTFSDKLADFAERAFEERWIDAEPRKGKRGGAFNSGLHSIKQCRILCNFNNLFSDVLTLAHELGHGYHGFLLYDESALNASYTMPIAETASTFCETIIMDAALKNANGEEKIALIEGRVCDAARLVVDVYSRFLFESEVFKRRENASLGVKELNEMMMNAQKEAYGDGLDPKYLHPYAWTNKPHYYFSNIHYYNFPYTFGLLFSMGLYAQYIRGGDEFLDKYDEILRNTGKHEIKDITAMVGIDITKESFWNESLDIIEKYVEEFLEL